MRKGAALKSWSSRKTAWQADLRDRDRVNPRRMPICGVVIALVQMRRVPDREAFEAPKNSELWIRK
jgi:hypothetical protein